MEVIEGKRLEAPFLKEKLNVFLVKRKKRFAVIVSPIGIFPKTFNGLFKRHYKTYEEAKKKYDTFH